MGKRSRDKKRAAVAPAADGAVGPRQPCPCGSGKRYKACHGAADGGVSQFVARPFEGLASECDLVALRELVPAATAPLTLSGEYADKSVTLCTLLPGVSPALIRDSGEIWLGLQVVHNSGDVSRDLGAVLAAALATEEPGVVNLPASLADAPRLQDLIVDEPLQITVHEGFGFWVADLDQSDPTVAAALEQADSAAAPTARLTSVPAAYWTDAGTREHLRWVMPEQEGPLLDALARLHAAGRDQLVPESRLIGMFRAHGLLAPVWDLPVGTGPEALEDPASDFAAALAEALADTSELTDAERSARAGLATRQVTIR
jgi:Family of unknown function (DUF5926)/SEC-C motif